jgi:putative tricarboxylic transport membrane protein
LFVFVLALARVLDCGFLLMEMRSNKDLVAGAALTASGLYVTVVSLRFSYMSEEGPGPGFLPFWLGIAIVALSLCLISVNQRRPAAKTIQRQSWSAETRALSGWLALMGTVFLAPLLGFSVSLMLLAIFIVTGLEGRPLRSAVIVALGLGVTFYIIFVVLLNLSLPAGPLGF